MQKCIIFHDIFIVKVAQVNKKISRLSPDENGSKMPTFKNNPYCQQHLPLTRKRQKISCQLHHKIDP